MPGYVGDWVSFGVMIIAGELVVSCMVRAVSACIEKVSV